MKEPTGGIIKGPGRIIVGTYSRTIKGLASKIPKGTPRVKFSKGPLAEC